MNAKVNFDITNLETEDDALKASNKFEMSFVVEGSLTSVTLTHEDTKFIMWFPDDYWVQGADEASTVANEGNAGTCYLYVMDFMYGEDNYANADKVYQGDTPDCKFNYLHHWLGNAVEF